MLALALADLLDALESASSKKATDATSAIAEELLHTLIHERGWEPGPARRAALWFADALYREISDVML